MKQTRKVLSDPERASALSRLQQLILKIPDDSNSVNGLMREHLKSAHSYLLGSMEEEYALSLRMAADLLPRIEGVDLQEEIAGFLRASDDPGSRRG
jgi:hypothetical protein